MPKALETTNMTISNLKRQYSKNNSIVHLPENYIVCLPAYGYELLLNNLRVKQGNNPKWNNCYKHLQTFRKFKYEYSACYQWEHAFVTRRLKISWNPLIVNETKNSANRKPKNDFLESSYHQWILRCPSSSIKSFIFTSIPSNIFNKQVNHLHYFQKLIRKSIKSPTYVYYHNVTMPYHAKKKTLLIKEIIVSLVLFRKFI